MAALILAIVTATFLAAQLSHDRRERRNYGASLAAATSRATFEAIYAIMRQGAGQRPIADCIQRLRRALPALRIRVLRGDAVVRQFGQRADDLAPDDAERRALVGDASEEMVYEFGAPYYRRSVPVLLERECLACHQAPAHSVAGVITTRVSLGDVQQAHREQWTITGLLLGGTLLAAALMTLLAVRRIVIRPIAEISAGVSAMAAGDLAHRIRVQSGDELEGLAERVNWMAGQLQAARAEETALLEERRRLEAREMAIAREVQLALLPAAAPQAEGWDVAWRLVPQMAVGGDLVQFAEGEGHLDCLVADVTGKGAPAAIVVGNLYQIYRQVRPMAPGEAVPEINRALCRSTPTGIFASLILLRLDTASGEIEYVNAGHPFPFVWRAAAGAVEEWTSGNLMAGWEESTPYSVSRNRLHPGDVLLVYTDGLTDCKRPDGQHIGEDSIRDLLREHAADPATDLADALVTLALSHRQADDVTLLVIRRKNRT